jgi:DNA-directed RNA polymerase subunit RPC12/RpoP
MKKPFISVTDVPRILEQWDFIKNDVNPEEVHSGSGLKFYWLCKNNHSYIDTASHRKEGRGCPVCSGRVLLEGINDLETIHPELSTEWNYKKNDKQPSEYLAGSNKKVWWICQEHHEWEAPIASRSKGNNGCPYCSGRNAITGFNDLHYKHPLLALEWHPSKNGDVLSSQVSEKSNKKFWWLCNKGHEWQASPGNRVLSGTNCPTCSSELRTSFPEQAIYYYLSKSIGRVDNRYIIDDKNTEIDIYIPSLKVGIEYNGAYFHKNKNRDQKKLELIEGLGITLYRIIETDKEPTRHRSRDLFIQYPVSFKNLDRVINGLISKLQSYTNLKLDRLAINTESDRMNIYGRYIAMEKESSILFTHPFIADRWDFEKNFPLKPNQVSFGSQKRVWWICVKGHSYENTVNHQIGNRYCPVCSGRLLMKGYNDLKTINPVLAKDWNYQKNQFNPDEISPGSPKKVWWKCEYGHEWKAVVSNRNRGNGCPYCSGRYVLEGINDLNYLYPLLVGELHPIKNKGFDPRAAKSGINKKLWWICAKGHEWEASVANRVKGRGCPVCANRIILSGINDLKSLNPDLAKEWNFNKNSISPDEVSIKSNKKVWWICAKGHEWETTISHRSNGTGCPICLGKKVLIGFNDLEFKHPIVTKFWDYNKNDFLPTEVTAGSNKYAYWLCSEGHSIYTKINNAIGKGLRCPTCNKRQFLP